MLSGVEYCYFLFHGDNSIFCKPLRSEESAKSMFGRNMAEGGFSCGSVVKNLPANAGDAGLILGKITWRRKWQSSPAFLPGKSHGEKCLAGCSPWGHQTVRHDLATDFPSMAKYSSGTGLSGGDGELGWL